MQAKSWGGMQSGDWMVEKRIYNEGDIVEYVLCVARRDGEFELPDELVEILKKCPEINIVTKVFKDED